MVDDYIKGRGGGGSMINVLTFIKYFLRLAVIIMLLGNLGICVDFPKATFPIFSRLTFDAIKVYG